MARPVHGGADVRAREHQQLGLLRVAPPARQRQVGKRLAGPPALVAQQPEAGARHRHVAVGAFGLAVPGAFHAVGGEPEEGEVVVLDPLEEGAGLRKLLRVDRRRRGPQVRDAAAKLLAHRGPVLHRGPHVVKGGEHLRAHRAERLLLGLAVGLDVDDRFDDGPSASSSSARSASARSPSPRRKRITGWTTRWLVYPRRFTTIRTESTMNGMSSVTISTMVWVDCPAVLLDLRVVDPDLRRARRAPPGEVQVRTAGAVEVVRLAFREVVGRDARVVPGDEGEDEVDVLAADPLARERGDLVHEFVRVGRGLAGHGRSPPSRRSVSIDGSGVARSGSPAFAFRAPSRSSRGVTDMRSRPDKRWYEVQRQPIHQCVVVDDAVRQRFMQIGERRHSRKSSIADIL